MERPYRFLVNPVREMQQLKFLFERIFNQIEANIAKREAQGIDQTQSRVLLSQLLKGNESYATPENLQLYRELVVEANTQLGYFTMPEEIFGKYKEIVKMTTYDSLKDQLGEDPRKHYKRQQVLLENESNRNIYTQLPDGRVPSFQEFKAIKDKITRTNEGLGSK